MVITDEQRAVAEEQQWRAARDDSKYIRLIAGPGTGKSYTIEKRAAFTFEEAANPRNVYILSFTRNTCDELKERVRRFCEGSGYSEGIENLQVRTLHSLALRILRRTGQLAGFVEDPRILDDWEQKEIFDKEIAFRLNINPSEAGELRRAYEAMWYTMGTDTTRDTFAPVLRGAFEKWHGNLTMLYSFVLPGEVIYKCVSAYNEGRITGSELPLVEHLIVDEYQDLNVCDQEFVTILITHGGKLFVTGDDDQSIYSFRHARPEGLIELRDRYPGLSGHFLTDCFRCTPAILECAERLIRNNPNRIEEKTVVPLYGAADPPVRGVVYAWAYNSQRREYQAIAESCRKLIDGGMRGEEEEIIILITKKQRTGLQIRPLEEALKYFGVPYDLPVAFELTKNKAIRILYVILRIMIGYEEGRNDIVAFRTLLGLLPGIALGTISKVEDYCYKNEMAVLDYLESFDSLNGKSARLEKGIRGLRWVLSSVGDFSITDSWEETRSVFEEIINYYFPKRTETNADILDFWTRFIDILPGHMTLGEIYDFLCAEDETAQINIFNEVLSRVNEEDEEKENLEEEENKKVKILTMHGAKGLSAKVVFIPSAEEGFIPNTTALGNEQKIIEQRRLFYVALTRAKAACIITFSNVHRGEVARLLSNSKFTRSECSRFVGELGVECTARTRGLSNGETLEIIEYINNL
jgi:DNA helicase-2/ATP-dependent DNA helicase PcrA